ncbi:hypothetical protein KY312_02080 [Candidatus Woesearchaeota archaeon]|nr:hypothetical protein [Candidatus Woesearchaeota archaeon]
MQPSQQYLSFWQVHPFSVISAPLIQECKIRL